MNTDRAQIAALDASSYYNARAEEWKTYSQTAELIEEREETHGDFSQNSFVSQAIKSVLRDHGRWHALTAVQSEALDHIAGKIGRIMSGNPNHDDHWRDIAGYAQLVLDRLEGTE